MRGKTIKIFVVLASTAIISSAALADDEDDVRAVIAEYVATETTDLAKQATLMSDDRVYITGGYRFTDNVANMKGQIATQNRNRATDPETQSIVTIEDLMVRMHGDAATVSFYRFFNIIWSADAIAAGATGPGPRQVVSMVLARDGREWKIVQTHQGPLGGQ
jgi:hypothetical protein